MSIKNDPPMDTEISDLYQSTQGDGPSTELDAAILAQAEAAVTPKRKRPAWIAPVGLAATLFLGVNLAVNLKDTSSTPDLYSEAGQSVRVQSNLPGPQVLSETEATSDDVAKDFDAIAQKPVTMTYRIGEPPLAQNEEITVSEGASSPGQAKSNADIDVDQMLRQVVSQGSRVRSSVENQQQSEHVKPERSSNEQKETVGRLAKRSAQLDASERRELSDTLNSVVANKPPPVSPRRDVTAPVAAAPPFEVDLRSKPSKSDTPAAPQASATTFPAAQAATPAPLAKDELDLTTEESDIQEVVVTGTHISQFNTSPYARPTAKDRAKRNEYQRRLVPDRNATSAAEAEVAADLYVCDLEALWIDTDRIEAAKVDALNHEPPLNALSWPGYIRDRAEENNYVEACTHLAAYQQMYPGIAMIELLPLTILKQK